MTVQIDNDTEVTPTTLTGTTYTSTTVVFTNSADLTDVKEGALITSLGSPTYTAMITAVDTGSKMVSVSGGWRPFTGVSGDTGIPTNGDSASIDYFSKIWGQNTNCFLQSGHPTSKMAGYEMGLLNYQANATTSDPSNDSGPVVAWGYDAVNLGAFDCSVAFVARAGASRWLSGFDSYGNLDGHTVHAKSGSPNTYGFIDRSGEGLAFVSKVGPGNVFAVNAATGVIEMGSKSVAQVSFIDFNTSGLGNDYDARLHVAGGSGTSGGGATTLLAASMNFGCVVRPNIDNSYSMGQAPLRWSEIFSANGTINTSDERSKEQIENVPDTVLDAWACVPKRRFKMIDAAKTKGDNARWHVGVIAQDIESAFKNKGLDATQWGVLCFDKWEEQTIHHPAIYKDLTDDNGDVVLECIRDDNGDVVFESFDDGSEITMVEKKKIVQYIDTEEYNQVIPAGERYGVRYSEAAQLDSALERREREKLLVRIKLLEEK